MRFNTTHKIYLSRLSHNFDELKRICPSNEVIFMVKANAYGHGMNSLVEFAYRENQIKEFGVASLGEALDLIQANKNLKANIYVFSDLDLNHQSSRKMIKDFGILPVISSESQLGLFLADSELNSIPLCLKYNTGMNRLGLEPQKVQDHIATIKKSGRNSIYHLMTHFSSSSQSVYKVAKSQRQYDSFLEVKKSYQDSNIVLERTSVSNSGAIEQKFGLDESHVRPGIMLYGPSSLIPELREKYDWKGKIISDLEAEVLRVFDGKKGDPVGYGAIPLPESGKVAVVSLGYGDGWGTSMRGVRIENETIQGTVVGRVNMDMCQILLDEDSKNASEGDIVSFWNQNLSSVYDLSDKSGLITYELFTSLSARVPKSHLQ